MILWYVVQTKPNKERDAGAYLGDRGLEILSPLLETFVVKNGRVNKEYKPLFPGYIFGKFDFDSSYSLVRWARGVKKVLSFGGYPVPISDSVVDLIRTRIDATGVVRTLDSFSPNDVIRIKAGPLRDLLGIFERWMPDRERVRILLNLVGYQPTIELHCSMLEKVA
jgi:transcriptional antiterminator RfaH